MINYKKDYKFDFPKGMRFFLDNINKCIEKNDIELNPFLSVKFRVKCFSFPYDYNAIRLIEKTFAWRNIDVKMKSYIMGTDLNKRRTYEYEFIISMIKK